MITIRAFRSALPLAIAAVLALPVALAAQQQTDDPPAATPAKKKKAAPKKKDATPANEATPAKKKQSAPVKQADPAKQAKPAKKQAAPQAAPLAGTQPTLLGQFGDWGAYAAVSAGRKVCYALAKPAATQTEPANRPRDPTYMLISIRPAENVRNEVSIIAGYPYQPGSEATVEVASGKYAMYTQNDGAWIKNAAEEARMIDALRRAGDLTVTGTSGRGTVSTDRYSLKGLAQALDRAAQGCQ